MQQQTFSDKVLEILFLSCSLTLTPILIPSFLEIPKVEKTPSFQCFLSTDFDAADQALPSRKNSNPMDLYPKMATLHIKFGWHDLQNLRL